MIIDELAQQFLRASREALGFLVAHGFRDGELVQVEHWSIIKVRFCGEKLAIESIWEDRDQDLDCKVVRLPGGLAPLVYAVDSEGRRVREGLHSMLLRQGLRAFGFRKLPSTTPVSELWRVQLEDYARLLRDHSARILQQDPGVFD